MKVKVFTKQNCPKCSIAKKLYEELKEMIPTEIYPVDEQDGLNEANHYEVISTPTIIIVDDKDEEIKSFRGTTPLKEEILLFTDAN